MAFKIIQIIVLASVKYFMIIPYALIIGMNFDLTMLSVIVGGVLGFLFFYYLSHHVTKGFNRVKPLFCHILPATIKARHLIFLRNRKERLVRIFTRKSRFIARLKRNYGLWGIVITTPVLLSIPFGAFLASKYYSHRKNVALYMVISIVGWGAVLSAFVHIFPAIVR